MPRDSDWRSRAAGSGRAIKPLRAHLGEELIYRDLAQEWKALTGLTFVFWRVWTRFAESTRLTMEWPRILLPSRDHGLANIDAASSPQWAETFPIPESTIRNYLTTNIHYVLDEECVEGMRGFFRMAAECGVLPPYNLALEELAAR